MSEAVSTSAEAWAYERQIFHIGAAAVNTGNIRQKAFMQ
jgi:hypothetical protein